MPGLQPQAAHGPLLARHGGQLPARALLGQSGPGLPLRPRTDPKLDTNCTPRQRSFKRSASALRSLRTLLTWDSSVSADIAIVGLAGERAAGGGCLLAARSVYALPEIAAHFRSIPLLDRAPPQLPLPASALSLGSFPRQTRPSTIFAQLLPPRHTSQTSNCS